MKSKKNNSTAGRESEISSVLPVVVNNKTSKKRADKNGHNQSAVITDEWDASHTKSPDKNGNPANKKKKGSPAKAQLTLLNQQLASLNEQLTAATQYAASIITCIKEPLLVLNETLHVKTANDAFYKTFGLNENDTAGKLIYELDNNQWNIPALQTLLQEVLLKKKSFNDVDVTYNFSGKGRQTFLLNAHEINGAAAAEKNILLTIKDITEKVMVQKNEKEYIQKLTSVFKLAPALICTLRGSEHVYEIANESYLNFVGNRNIIGKPVIEVIPEIEGQGYIELLDEVYKTGKPYIGNEMPAKVVKDNGRRQDGFLNFVIQPLLDANGKTEGIFINAVDVTEQVLARKKIEESEHRYAHMIYTSPSLIAIFKGKDMVIEIANDAILESWGKGKNIIGKSLFEVIPESVEQGFDKMLLSVYKTGEPVYAYETPITLIRNGKPELVYYNFNYQAQRNLNGVTEGVAVIANEVTSQALLNLKIKASEEQFRLLVLQAPVAICVLRGENYIIEVINESMIEIWDRTMEQALNKPAFDVLPELKEQGFKELLDNVYHTGERFVADELPITLKRKGKLENAFVKFIYEPLREADGTITGVMALAHEITEQVLSRKKIEESETKFRTLIEDAPVATCLFTGREMTVEVANDIMIGYWGKDKSVIGKPLEDAVPELKGQPFLKILDDVFTTGKTYHSNNARAELKIGGVLGTYYFDFTYKPILNAVGEVYGIMDMAVDVTEQVLARKKIEESEAHFRRLSDLMPAKISNANKNGDVTYFNKQWIDFSGYSFEELKDFGYHKMLHPDELEEFQTRFKKAADTGTVLEMEMRFKNKKGEYKWHLNLASPVLDENGEIKMWVGVTTEIQKIKEEEERRGDFIKMVSHELKTPVTSIKGYVQLLLMIVEDEKDAVFPAPVKSSLIRIDKQILKLTRLIAEMLDLSRIESDSLELQKEIFSINDLAAEAVEDIVSINASHTILLKQEFACNVFGDRDRIGQVMINFITNAIKYSPNNNNVEVTVYKGEKNEVAVSVQDFGVGIDKEEHKKIFERFYRVGGKSEQTFPGFGIGLFISHSIIGKHNGSIRTESEQGKGSTFTFTLPVAQENNPQNG